MNENDINLFSEFPPVSTEAWEAQINSDLKGKDYEKSLVWQTNEGFKVKPYYREEHLKDLSFINSLPGQFPYVRGKKIAGNEGATRSLFCTTIGQNLVFLARFSETIVFPIFHIPSEKAQWAFETAIRNLVAAPPR
jgi:hypothetical protein